MSDSAGCCTESDGATLRELPPSAKLVARTLDAEGDLTHGQLVDETLLPARTVRNALRTLEEEDLVTAKLSFIDARQRIYSLTVEWPGGTGDS
jgi:DNA-binding MarR family transcriptional regulator